MLKKLLKMSLHGLLIFSLNVFAESDVRIEIETHGGRTRIDIETGASDPKSFEGFTDLKPSYNEQGIERNIKPEDIIAQSWFRHPGDTVCTEEKACKDICREIYHFVRDRRKCEILPITQVRILGDIKTIFKSIIIEDASEEINAADLALLLAIDNSDKILRDARRLSISDAKSVLVWIVEDDNVTDHLIENRKLLEALISAAGIRDYAHARDAHLAEAFINTPISQGDSFIDLAFEHISHKALDSMHKLFEESCTKNPDHIRAVIDPVCIFKERYCKTHVYWDDLLMHDNFDFAVKTI